MNGPKSPLTQKPEMRDLKEVETEEDARALIILAFGGGGSRSDVTAILRKEGFHVSESALNRRLHGIGQEAYVQELRSGKDPSKEVMAKNRDAVRAFLLSKPYSRERVWNKFSDTRALALALLEQNANFGHMAKILAHYLGLPHALNDSSIRHAQDEAKGTFELMQKLRNGTPPYTDPLDDKDIEKGEKLAKGLLEIFDDRIDERHAWFKNNETRAFVLALLSLGATAYAVRWALKERFKMDITPKALRDQLIKELPDAPRIEQRADFIRRKERGIPEVNKTSMAVDAQTMLQNYFNYLRERSRVGAELGAITSRRLAEFSGRNSYKPFNDLIAAIQSRQNEFHDDRRHLHVELEYAATPSAQGPVPTVFVRVRDIGGREVQTLSRYMRDELREMQAGFAGKMRDALSARAVRMVPEVRAMFRGPEDDEDAVFWLDPTSPARR